MGASAWAVVRTSHVRTTNSAVLLDTINLTNEFSFSMRARSPGSTPGGTYVLFESRILVVASVLDVRNHNVTHIR